MVTLSHLLTLASTCNHHNSFSAQVTKKSIVVRFSTRPIKMSGIYIVVTIGLSPYTLYALSKKLQMFRFNIASFCTLTTFHSTTAELLDICTSMLKYQLYAMKASDAIILLERRYHKSAGAGHIDRQFLPLAMSSLSLLLALLLLVLLLMYILCCSSFWYHYSCSEPDSLSAASWLGAYSSSLCAYHGS